MASFRPESGMVMTQLEAHEASLLRRLVGELRELLTANLEGDPINVRLFPDAYEEPSDQAKYRDLIGDGLHSLKLQALDGMSHDLGTKGEMDKALDEEGVNVWLTALTDIRLALGTRLDISEETMQAEPDPGDPDAGALAVLHWLGWMQESLLEAINLRPNPTEEDDQ